MEEEREKSSVIAVLCEMIFGLVFFICLCGFIAALLLYFVAVTDGGKAVAATLLLGLPAVVTSIRSVISKEKIPWLTATVLLLIFCGVNGYRAITLAPDGDAEPEAAFKNVWLGEPRYSPCSVANLVPEVDQFIFGSYLIPVVDRFMDHGQAEHMRSLLRSIYGEMREDPEFLRSGSVMNYAYRDMMLPGGQSAHHYLYMPQGASSETPVLVFLHGSFGNFKGYMWVLKTFADKNGFAIIAPDNGFGYWRNDATKQIQERTLKYIEQHPQLNASKVFLAGLSNGGIGATYMAQAKPEAWKGLCLISPVIPPEGIPRLAQQLKQHTIPIQLVSGEIDRRIPAEYVKKAHDQLEAAGVNSACNLVPDEDHFLMFSQPEVVVEELENLTFGVRKVRRKP